MKIVLYEISECISKLFARVIISYNHYRDHKWSKQEEEKTILEEGKVIQL